MAEFLWFLFHDTQLLLFAEATRFHGLPLSEQAPLPPAGAIHDLGRFQGIPCKAASIAAIPPECPCTLTDLRASYDILGRELYAIAGKGAQLLHWDASSRFCSWCGAKTQPATPLSKRCTGCGKDIFPLLATAIIVLVRKGDSILMVRAHNFRGDYYGLVAGFLEPGETLEECVRREVCEETGLAIKNIRYFGCQPWPYPNNVMVGFVADYDSGTIRLQENELCAGQFFSRNALPNLPPPLSLARQLINWWLDHPEEQPPR